MGGKGSGRISKVQKIVNDHMDSNRKSSGVIPSDTYIVPNHSGDHSAGNVQDTPVADTDIANKKYVDDNSTSAAGNNTEIQFNDNGAFGADPDYIISKTSPLLTIDSSATSHGLWLKGAGAIRFSNDPNTTGIYENAGLNLESGSASRPINFLINGTKKMELTTAGNLDMNSNNISEVGELFFNGASNFSIDDTGTALSFQVGGTEALQINDNSDVKITRNSYGTGLTIENNGFTTEALEIKSSGVTQLSFRHDGKVRGQAGSKASPTFSFFNDGNTGMFSNAADTLMFTAGNQEVGAFKNSVGLGLFDTTPSYLIDAKQQADDNGFRIYGYDDVNSDFLDLHVNSSGEGVIETNTQDLVIDCGTDKTIELTEPVYKDINLGAAQLSRPTSSQPDLVTFTDENGADTGIQTYGFAPGEKIHGSFELQHDYKEGTDLVFHVHFQGDDAPTGTDKVKWELTYTFQRMGSTLDATTTINIECDYDTQYEGTICSFAAISDATLNIGDQMLFTLERVAASADEYGGDAKISTVGVHYEVDTLGSRQITSK